MFGNYCKYAENIARVLSIRILQENKEGGGSLSVILIVVNACMALIA